MKKRLCAAIVLLALLALIPSQAAPQISWELFSTAKKALACLARGEYALVADALPFSGAEPDAGEWERFARNFTSLKQAQQDYAVAYWKDGCWRLAVPAQVPDNGSVEALVLLSDDGASFSGYRYMTWSNVERELASSERVVWDKEYVGSSARVYD